MWDSPAPGRKRSAARALFAIAFTAMLLNGPAARASGPAELALSRATGRQVTLRDLDSLLAAGRYGAAVAPALELAATLGPNAPADSNATASLDQVVAALLAGGHGADSLTVELAGRAMRAHAKPQRVGAVPPGAAVTAWARCLATRGDDAAAAAFERGLAIEAARSTPDSLRVAEALEWLGRAQIERGDAAGASGPIVRALAIREHALGTQHRDVARSLDALALDLFELGDFPKARAAAESALAIREKALPARHPEIAESLDRLGTILQARVEWGDDKLMRGVLKFIRNRVQPKHSTLVWDFFNSATESNNQPKDFARAGRCFDRALSIRVEMLGPLHPETATSALNLGRHRQVLGDEYQAMGHLRRALAIREQAFDAPHPAVAEALDAIGDLLVDDRNPVAARPYFERALAIQGRTLGPDDPQVASSLLGLAHALAAVGDATPAAEYARRALVIREKRLGPDHPLVGEALIAVADLDHDAGDDAAADPRYARALALVEKFYGPEHPRVADACESWALARRDRDDLDGARPLLDRALAIRKRAFGDEHPDVGRTLNEMVWVNNTTDGDNILRNAAYIFGLNYGSGHPAIAECRRDQALLNWWNGAADSAAVTSAVIAEEERQRVLMASLASLPERQALALCARTPRSLDLALTQPFESDPFLTSRVINALIASRGLVLDELGVRRLGALDSDTASVRLEAAYQEASGRLASMMVRGHGSQSATLYRQLIADAEHDREQAERALGDHASSRRNPLRRVGVSQVDAALAKGAAIVSFVRYERYEFVKPNRTLLQSLVNNSSHTFKEPLRPRDYRLVPSYIAIVTRRDRSRMKAMFTNFKTAMLSHAEESNFDPHATVVRQVVRLGDAAEIDSLAARWVDAASRGPLRLPSEPADRAILSVGQALRKRIWDPLAKGFGASDRVFIVPDGTLQLVNFAALPAADGSYLIERPPLIHLLSTERDLALVAAAPAAGGRLLALGGPDYDDACAAESVATRVDDDSLLSRGAPRCVDFSAMRFPPLPAATGEVEEIGHLWRTLGDSTASRAVTLTGARACEGEFKLRARGNAVIHLATHGFFVPASCSRIATEAAAEPTSRQTQQELHTTANAANPLTLCGLVLAGANRRAEALPGWDDGILTAQEVAALDLRGTQWVVLSACESGVGEVVSGEGVFGLRRAFQMAGARTQIISLWSVADDPTREWMNSLYQAHFVKGVSTMEAVRTASLARLTELREHGLSTHPYYWAAFVASGDWR